MVITNWVVIAFVVSPATDSPNIGASSDGDARQRYCDAIECAAASVKRWAPGYRCVVVTDEPSIFKRIDVETIERSFDHRPETTLHDKFNASLYLLDAMAEMACRAGEDDSLLFLDPDCLVVRSLDPVMEVARQCGVAGLPIHYPLVHEINGLSRTQAGAVGERLDGISRTPVHFGGELYAVTGLGLRRLVAMLEPVFVASVEFASRGEPHFTTEEHILSFAIDRMGGGGDLSPFARRIWTSMRHRTASRADEGLVVWHLPAEKALGFQTLVREVRREESWFWSASNAEFVRRSASIMGIRHGARRRVAEARGALSRFFSARSLAG